LIKLSISTENRKLKTENGISPSPGKKKFRGRIIKKIMRNFFQTTKSVKGGDSPGKTKHL